MISTQQDQVQVVVRIMWRLHELPKAEYKLADEHGTPNSEQMIQDLMRNHAITGAALESDRALAHEIEGLDSARRRELLDAAAKEVLKIWRGR